LLKDGSAVKEKKETKSEQEKENDEERIFEC